MSHIRRYAIVFLLTISSVANAVDKSNFGLQPTLPLMPKLEGKWIAKQMTMNGLSMSIRAIKGRTAPDKVIAYYKNAWRDKGHKVAQSQDGDWQVVASRYDDKVDGKQEELFVTIRVRPSGTGSEGTIVVSKDPLNQKVERVLSLPVPSFAAVISHQSYLDAGVSGESVTLLSKRSVTETYLAIQNNLTRDGWAVLTSRPSTDVSDGWNLELSKVRRYTRIFVARDRHWDNQTLVLITTMQG